MFKKQASQPIHSALWVQLHYYFCSAPINLLEIMITHSKTCSSRLVVLELIANPIVFFNLTLNPFLYRWRISEVSGEF